MISVHLDEITSARAEIAERHSWVTLYDGSGSRAVIHTVNFNQAVAIADAINSEAEARRDRPAASRPESKS